MDNAGNPVGANVSVIFNINGVFYTRYTNASGVARLNINLNPGEYIITAEYNGYKASNTIKVLPTLKAKDLSMKYKDGSKFNVTVLNGSGNPLANAITYSVDNQDYSQFASRLFNGINDGLAAVTYGEKFNILITNIPPTYSPADVGKMATNVIFDKTVKAVLSIIKDIVCN
ncbi:carboxypeptidase-like regulatory domain-containing protein [Methanobrevibacter millerae]|uniref:Adhesin-like protein n=1 Tax=Methanobrevibacter millerae TaxID=230361 RepID=A0A1G5XNP1_9EURY|nr:carboxypeptidase-like regulatory domain-containing protein [Methanobrevibacter millerae]SDA71205.1 hypothetical protein SAMN02910315_02344 [Methanobrevibacter millerae]